MSLNELEQLDSAGQLGMDPADWQKLQEESEVPRGQASLTNAQLKQIYGFKVSGNLYENLQYYKNDVLYNDSDCLVIIDGSEGAGKSVLAQQVGVLLSPHQRINPKYVVFTAQQLIDAVVEAPKNEVIIWDEAMGGLNVRRTMSGTNVKIVDLLAEVRQKNLFMIFVMPTFYEMDKYSALWRSACLLHVYRKPDLENKTYKRGYYKFYSGHRKKMLYTDKRFKSRYVYPERYCNFKGTFGAGYQIDEELYRTKKLEALRSYQDKKDEGGKRG